MAPLLVGAILIAFLIGRNPALASGTSTTAAAASNDAHYCDVYVHALASSLKVSPAQLAAANKSALQTTVEQAYKDGSITQAQETQMLNQIKQLGADPCADLARAVAARHDRLVSAHTAVVNAVATTLKLSPATVEKNLASGQTVAQMASAQHVSLADVNAAYLSAVRTQLNATVASGMITQSQADKMYANIERAVAAGKYPLLRAPM
jgi:hypothetical protein